MKTLDEQIKQDCVHMSKYGELAGKVDKRYERFMLGYFNDLNSSTLREMVTAEVSGYKSKGLFSGDKHGSDVDDGDNFVEIKPTSVTKNKPKLNGAGGFSDFTWKRLDKYKKNNVTMLVSGFVNGRLFYVLKFPFSVLENKIVSQLEKKLPDGDKLNDYVRCAGFNHNHYKDFDEVELVYLNEEFLDFGVKEFRKFLVRKSDENNKGKRI
jgi:hypothetical protein